MRLHFCPGFFLQSPHCLAGWAAEAGLYYYSSLRWAIQWSRWRGSYFRCRQGRLPSSNIDPSCIHHDSAYCTERAGCGLLIMLDAAMYQHGSAATSLSMNLMPCFAITHDYIGYVPSLEFMQTNHHFVHVQVSHPGNISPLRLGVGTMLIMLCRLTKSLFVVSSYRHECCLRDADSKA
ncbi:hypothetical protein F5884DRAFT_762447, partial [Xylogone sp. PMI_703]